ncbi:MAG: class I tRNA ligase family protein, partial [Candidatus Omnitrophota bacterium]|nr:class I tRNA ligase family protein [Candidatus Omnitrophota bacterium]
NTYRYILGNLYDFNPSEDAVKDYKKFLEIDRWALSRCQVLLKKATQAYSDFSFYQIYHPVHNFCAVDMSSFYLDVLKDRLYTFAKGCNARRSAQTVLYEILLVLVKIMAPILPYTSEEVWQYLPGKHREVSVHICQWPKVNEKWIDKDLEQAWQRLLEIRQAVCAALEQKRISKEIKSSLEAKVFLFTAGDEVYSFLQRYKEQLPAVFIVSDVELTAVKEMPADLEKFNAVKGLGIRIGRSDGLKCQRCWNWSKSVGEDEQYPGLCQRCREVTGLLRS